MKVFLMSFICFSIIIGLAEFQLPASELENDKKELLIAAISIKEQVSYLVNERKRLTAEFLIILKKEGALDEELFNIIKNGVKKMELLWERVREKNFTLLSLAELKEIIRDLNKYKNDLENGNNKIVETIEDWKKETIERERPIIQKARREVSLPAVLFRS